MKVKLWNFDITVNCVESARSRIQVLFYPYSLHVYTVTIDGRIEDWLNKVLDEMRRTNRFITKRAIFEYGKERERLRTDWIMMFQGMICLASNQVWWTAEVEEVFFKISKGNKRAMKEFLAEQNKQIDDLVLKGI